MPGAVIFSGWDLGPACFQLQARFRSFAIKTFWKMAVIDSKAEAKWRKSRISYHNYKEYIDRKQDKFALSLVDLLYISNFKGGNGAIHEKEDEVNLALSSYSYLLKDIWQLFGDNQISRLSPHEIQLLVSKVEELCSLTSATGKFKIDGFGVSYLSALLNIYFPNLIPILDRRVLLNSGLATVIDLNSQGQIIEIMRFYGPLIKAVARIAAATGKSVVEIDRDLFIMKLGIKRY